MDHTEFSKWARQYEQDIVAMQDSYPFAGYFKIIEQLSLNIESIPSPRKILDLGVGTGFQLDHLLNANDFDYVGLEFSEQMLVEAARRLDEAKLMYWNIATDELPKDLSLKSFDMVLSSFTFHHFDLEKKFEILKRYKSLLKPGGLFAIADISFRNREALEKVRAETGKSWDSEEEDGYFIKPKFVDYLKERGQQVRYIETSICTGIYYFQ